MACQAALTLHRKGNARMPVKECFDTGQRRCMERGATSSVLMPDGINPPSPEPLVTLAGEGFWNVTRQQSLPQQAKPAVQGKVAVSGKSMVCLGLTEEVVSLKRTING
jgi:hypothetical protein